MENVISVTSIVIILAAPILKSLGMSFAFVENIVVRFLLIAALIFAVRNSSNPLPGLLAFLAVFTLLLERNHEFLSKTPASAPASAPREMALPNQKPDWPNIEYDAPAPPSPLTPTDEIVHFDGPITSETVKVREPDVEFKGESTSVRDYENTDDIRDNIPNIQEGPGSRDAIQFYTDKNLL
jgi:hypothetical protein